MYVCMLLRFCVGLDHFGCMLLVLLGWIFIFQYRAKRLAEKNVSKMTLHCVEWDVKPCSVHVVDVLVSIMVTWLLSVSRSCLVFLWTFGAVIG